MSGTFVQDLTQLAGEEGVIKIIIDPVAAETRDLTIVAHGCAHPTTQSPTTTASTTISTTTETCTYFRYMFSKQFVVKLLV